jgi:hypothetical protein
LDSRSKTRVADVVERKAGFHVLNLNVIVNKPIPGQRLKPDVEFELSRSRVMVDVVASIEQPGSMMNAYQRKFERYSSLGRILPLVVGYLSWILDVPEVLSDSRPEQQRSKELSPEPEAENITPFPVEDPYLVD